MKKLSKHCYTRGQNLYFIFPVHQTDVAFRYVQPIQQLFHILLSLTLYVVETSSVVTNVK